MGRLHNGERFVGCCLALLVFVGTTSAIQVGTTTPPTLFDITRIAGKTPDRCIMGSGVIIQGTNAQADCAPTTPASSRTLIIPSETSANYGTLGGSRVAGGTFPINIVGSNLNNIPATATVCLGRYDAGLQVARPCSLGCDDNFASQAITQAAGGTAGTSASFVLPTNQARNRAWNTVSLELEQNPRRICLQSAPGVTPVWLGVNLGVVYSCTTVNDCQRTALPTGTFAQYGTLNEFEVTQILARNTTCCRTNTDFNNEDLLVGTCINNRVQQCCGATPIFPGASKCCNAARETVAFHEGFCPCNNLNTDCPAAEPICCNATKYAQFSTLNPVPGQCYNSSRHACCDTGNVYDPGAQQCCSINGLQSLNVPCPCDSDLDCVSGTRNLTLDRFACCKQSAPLPYVDTQCSAFSNFPVGTAPYQVQRCTGVCIDTSYQICCNGVVCRREFEKCCNSTCCNRFTGACREAIRPSTVGNQYNFVEFGVKYQQCSEIESLHSLRAFWVFALPVALLLMTLLALGLMLVFANKAATRSYSFVEAAMIGIGALLILFAVPFFFSPFYKYGVIVVFVALIAIAAAAVRAPVFNIIAAIALLLLLLYLVDPFHGNDYLNFSYLRTYFGEPDPESAGIFNSVGKLYRNDSSVRDIMYCTQWYDYFKLDNNLRDTERYHNPYISTFGYCSRAWITALLIFGAILLILALLLFLLALMGLLLRFRQMRFEPVELEVRGTDAPIGMGIGDNFLDGLGDDDLLD